MIRSILALPFIVNAALAHAEDSATLIGVNAYQNFASVPGANAVTLAEEFFDATGFAAEARQNATREEAIDALVQMANRTVLADSVVVVLSGHFLNFRGSTWYIPADSERPNIYRMGEEAVSVDVVARVLSEAPGQALLILGVADTEEDFVGRIELGIGDLSIPQGVTVMHGSVERVADFVNSELVTAGNDLIAAARRSGLALDGYIPDEYVAVAAQNPQVLANRIAALREEQAWQTARETNTAAAFRSFLSRFPDGANANRARQGIRALQPDPNAQARANEDALNLTLAGRRMIQRGLIEIGFLNGGADGTFGPQTRAAIKDWQEKQDYRASGYLTWYQIQTLEQQAERARSARLSRDRAAWATARDAGTVAGFERYLEAFPSGRFAARANEELTALQAQQDRGLTAQARREEQTLGLTPLMVTILESRLHGLGYEAGRIDGRIDDKTRQGLREYQRAIGVPATGYINADMRARLIQ